MLWIRDALTYWGYGPEGKGKIRTPERELELPWVPRNVVQMGPDTFAAFSDDATDIAVDGFWQGGRTYGGALDMAEDGTAIFRHPSGEVAPVLLNGILKPITRTAAFDVPQEWRSSGVQLLDTSSFGWILARKGLAPGHDYAAMLPIRLEASFTDRNGQTVREAAGVDDTSATADLVDTATQDRLWIMAPQGVAKPILWTSPLYNANPLVISGPGLSFGGLASYQLNGHQTAIQFQANGGPSGAEVLLDLKAGGVTASVSKPVGVKIMKQRTIKLAVYKVTKAATATAPAIPATLVPDEQELEDYLNDIYRPQLNVSFEVKVEPTPLVVDWDTGTVNKSLDGNNGEGDLSTEQLLIQGKMNELLTQQAQEPGHVAFNPNFNLYLVGCEKPISTDAFGITSRETKTCWVIGNFVSPMNSDTALLYDPDEGHMHNIAHEIGHVLVGPGHPDEKDFPGPAPLMGTNRKLRLMASGSASGSSSAFERGKLLVKGEWDDAEAWMAAEIDGGP